MDVRLEGDLRRQCCRAEYPKAAETTSPSPHGKQGSSQVKLTHHLTSSDLLFQSGATFLVRQVLMTEVKRIRGVEQGSSGNLRR